MEYTGALNAIRLSVAPVFLLTAIAALIGAIATQVLRFARRMRL